jgi:hypothetical protein
METAAHTLTICTKSLGLSSDWGRTKSPSHLQRRSKRSIHQVVVDMKKQNSTTFSSNSIRGTIWRLSDISYDSNGRLLT